jgi:tryptophan-rich sensory protein
MKASKAVEIGRLALCILVCQLAGLFGSLFTRSSVGTWYAGLTKPSFSPPGWVFGPVWITLYLLMAVAAYFVWRRGWDKRAVKAALGLFALQLLFNALWSAAFFGMRSVLLGLVDISLLWIALFATTVLFFRISRAAGILLLPYVLWLSFAVVLNISLLVLNA